MTDILKMPKIVYVRIHQCAPGGLEVMAVNHEAGHEYIRADVAKEREARLIKAAYYVGFMDAKKGVNSFFFDSKDAAVVYREAGLEELE